MSKIAAKKAALKKSTQDKKTLPLTVKKPKKNSTTHDLLSQMQEKIQKFTSQ